MALTRNFTNLTTVVPSSNSTFLEPGYVIWLKVLAYVGVFIASFGGNCFVILAYNFSFNRKIRTVSNTFIVSMAVADLFLTIASIPERITRVLTHDEWVLPGDVGFTACKLVNFVEKLSLNVSVLQLASIAIDRFLVVFFPRKKIITRLISIRIVEFIWATSIINCFTTLVYEGFKQIQQNKKYIYKNCKVRFFFEDWRISWYILYLIILYGTFFLLIIVLYSAIAVQLLRKKTPGVRIRMSVRSRRTEKLNLRIIKLVAIITAVFYICFLPYWIGWIFCSYHFSAIICHNDFVFVAIFLSYLNSALNPVIYTIFNENFRIAFRLFTQRICCVRVGRGDLNSRGRDCFIIGPRIDSGLATDTPDIQTTNNSPPCSLDQNWLNTTSA